MHWSKAKATPEAVAEAKSELAPRLMSLRGVTGVGLGRSRGRLAILVNVAAGGRQTIRRVREIVDGYPVRIVRTGPFWAFWR